MHISGLEKVRNILHNSFVVLSATETLKATAILFRPVAQVNSRFKKTSSWSDPLNSRISISRRQFNLSSSVFQFDGWSQMQPCGHSACAWNQKQINSFKINWYCRMTQKERIAWILRALEVFKKDVNIRYRILPGNEEANWLQKHHYFVLRESGTMNIYEYQ